MQLKTILVTVSLFLAFGAVDLFTLAAINLDNLGPDSGWILLAAVAVAICIAQVTLIAAWAVFAPGNLVVRFPWSLLFVLSMWYVLLIGERCFANGWPAWRRWNPQNEIVLGEALLVGVSVLQIPLWITKRVFGFRMLGRGESRTLEQDQFQFQLRHMLLGTFLFALALSPIRFFLPRESVGVPLPNDRLGLVILPAVIIVTLVTALPGLWVGFVSNRRLMGMLFGWAVYTLLVTVVEILILTAILGPPHGNEYVVFCILNLTPCAVVFAVMRIYHALGFRMERISKAKVQ